MFLVPQMIYLLVKYQIISYSVNKSEMHPSLSKIAKFISLIYMYGLRFSLYRLYDLEYKTYLIRFHKPGVEITDPLF